MASMATRPVRGLVALLFIAASAFMAPNFATLGGSLKHAARSTRTTARAAPVRVHLPPFTPLPWTEDLEGRQALHQTKAADTMKAKVNSIVQHIVEVDMGLHALKEPTKQQLQQYDKTLSAHIQELKAEIEVMQGDLRRDTMALETTAQLEWLENVLQTVAELKARLGRVQAAHGSVNSRLASGESGFFEKMIRAAACGFGGSKVASSGNYPATGASSFTGEPCNAP